MRPAVALLCAAVLIEEVTLLSAAIQRSGRLGPLAGYMCLTAKSSPIRTRHDTNNLLQRISRMCRRIL